MSQEKKKQISLPCHLDKLNDYAGVRNLLLSFLQFFDLISVLPINKTWHRWLDSHPIVWYKEYRRAWIEAQRANITSSRLKDIIQNGLRWHLKDAQMCIVCGVQRASLPSSDHDCDCCGEYCAQVDACLRLQIRGCTIRGWLVGKVCGRKYNRDTIDERVLSVLLAERMSSGKKNAMA
jgi:hypothetical protein